jgi:hypothetical protein
MTEHTDEEFMARGTATSDITDLYPEAIKVDVSQLRAGDKVFTAHGDLIAVAKASPCRRSGQDHPRRWLV